MVSIEVVGIAKFVEITVTVVVWTVDVIWVLGGIPEAPIVYPVTPLIRIVTTNSRASNVLFKFQGSQ